VIDTPGMRSLHVSDTGFGIETLFAEITERAPACKFRDCTHTHEPGCAVQAAVAAGEFPAERLMRWRKLNEESLGLPPSQPRPNGAARGKKR
jgi:ribosome biogenesis GTPase